MFTIYKYIAPILLISIVLFSACSDSTTSAGEGEVVINGSVEGDASQAKINNSNVNSNATVVWAATVTSSGSIEKIGETETEVSSNGSFTLTVDDTHSGNLVVVAEQEGNRLKGFISADIENGNSYTLKPINGESTAETSVFARLVAEGDASLVHKSDIEAVVRSNNEAAIRTSSSAAAEVAAAVQNSAETRMEFFAEFGSDAQAQAEQYADLMTDIQFEFEAALHNSSSAEAREAAFEAFVDAKVNAYTEVESDVSAVVKLLHAQSEVVKTSLNSVSAEVKSDVQLTTSLMTAIAADMAVRTSAEASELSQSTISAIADAGSGLIVNIRGSGGAETDISTAFESYRNEVRAAIENDSSTEATVIVTIDAELTVGGGVKAAFESALSGILGGSSITEVYVTYESGVRSSVESKADLIGSVDVEAIADIMVLIYLF